MKSSNKKGFTLIELLVVISIISLLSSIIFASVTNAQSKGRDSRRISDVRQLMTALELYRSDVGYYPTSLYGLIAPVKYIASIPTDPLGGAGPSCRPNYCYAYYPPGTSSYPTSYHLGVNMENLGSVLNSDADFNSVGIYSSESYATGFDGTVSTIYDIKN